MNHVTHSWMTHESCHTFLNDLWIMSHILHAALAACAWVQWCHCWRSWMTRLVWLMSHITHSWMAYEFCHTFWNDVWVTSHILEWFMSHVTLSWMTCESCHTFLNDLWVMSHILECPVSHVTLSWMIHESCHTFKSITSHSRLAASTCVTWLIDVCDMTHTRVRHNSFMYTIWLIHVCDMTHACCLGSVRLSTLVTLLTMTLTPAHGGDQTCNIWISRLAGLSGHSIEWRGLRLLTWHPVWNCGDSGENVIHIYGDSRVKLLKFGLS